MRRRIVSFIDTMDRDYTIEPTKEGWRTKAGNKSVVVPKRKQIRCPEFKTGELHDFPGRRVFNKTKIEVIFI